MKKLSLFFAVIIVIGLFFMTTSTLATSSTVDFSSFSFSELKAIQADLTAEIMSKRATLNQRSILLYY